MDDLIQIIPVLTDEEVIELNEYIEEHLSFTQSGTLEGTKNEIGSYRTSTECPLPGNMEITQKLHLKLNSALVEYKRRVLQLHPGYNKHPLPGAPSTSSWREDIRIIQYVKDQHYGFHHDQGTMQCRSEYHRQISIILYLTDEFEGGETAFVHKSFKPKKGNAIIFPANWCYLHQGNPVTKGFKRIAVTWYYVDSLI